MRRSSQVLWLTIAMVLGPALLSPASAETVTRGDCSEQERRAGTDRPDGQISSRSGAGAVSSQVTAGNGVVSGATTFGSNDAAKKAEGHTNNEGGSQTTTTQRNGRSVTVTSSGNGGASSSVATSSSTNGTAAAAGSGDCVTITD